MRLDSSSRVLHACLLAAAFALRCNTYDPSLLEGRGAVGVASGTAQGGEPPLASGGAFSGNGGAPGQGGASRGGGNGTGGSGTGGSGTGGSGTATGGSSGSAGSPSDAGAPESSGGTSEAGGAAPEPSGGDTSSDAGAGGAAPSGSCGNDVVDEGEDCDDGNVIDRDGCSSVCTLWFDADFTRRTRLDVDNPGEAVEQFPLIVTLDGSSIDWDELGNAGVCLVADDQATELPTEIELWNPGSDSLLWTQAPALAASSVSRIWLYYGNIDDTEGCAPAGSVWSNDFAGVWHLDGSDESTSHAHAMTDDGTMDAAGAVGRGRTVSDGSGLVGPSDAALHITGDVTVSAWVSFSKLDSGTYDNSIVTYGNDQFVLAGNFAYGFYGRPDGSLATYWAHDDSTTVYLVSGTSTMDLGAFHQVVLVRDTSAGVVRFYLDGAKVGDDVAYPALPNGGEEGHLLLGGNVAGDSYAMNGVLDEVRISSSVASEHWIALDYAAVMGTLITAAMDP